MEEREALMGQREDVQREKITGRHESGMTGQDEVDQFMRGT